MVNDHLVALWERTRALGAEFKFTFEQTVILAVLAFLALTGGLLAARAARPLPIAIASERVPAERQAATAATTEGPEGESRPLPARSPVKKKLLVHVAGDVAKPGLHRLMPGARVADAIEAAGGPTDTKALDNLNLAAKVSDGQKVLVGLTPPVSTGSGGSAVAGVSEMLIGINSAGLPEIQRLDGIGPVLAARIVAWRERHGRFQTVSQLNKVSGIGPKKYAGLKEQVLID